MKKISIKNRKGEALVILAEINPRKKGLVFIQHGLGGFKEQKHIQVMADAFKEAGYSIIRFDTTCSIGESGGKMENVTITQSLADLEDVINWAGREKWYQEPFALAGHSLGSICVALFAQKYPKKVKLLAPISTLVSGRLSYETKPKEVLAEWKKRGYIKKESTSKPGVMKRIGWSCMEDRLKYDLLERVDRLRMPVLLVVGEYDESTPVKHQKMLYNVLPGKRELHIIKGSPHTFVEPEHLKELGRIFQQWLKKYA